MLEQRKYRLDLEKCPQTLCAIYISNLSSEGSRNIKLVKIYNSTKNAKM